MLVFQSLLIMQRSSFNSYKFRLTPELKDAALHGYPAWQGAGRWDGAEGWDGAKRLGQLGAGPRQPQPHQPWCLGAVLRSCSIQASARMPCPSTSHDLGGGTALLGCCDLLSGGWPWPPGRDLSRQGWRHQLLAWQHGDGSRRRPSPNLSGWEKTMPKCGQRVPGRVFVSAL